jgi:hypothetical protein
MTGKGDKARTRTQGINLKRIRSEGRKRKTIARESQMMALGCAVQNIIATWNEPAKQRRKVDGQKNNQRTF